MYENEEVLGTSQDNQEIGNTSSQTPVDENSQYQNHQGGKKNKKKNKSQYQQAHEFQQQHFQQQTVQEQEVEEKTEEESEKPDTLAAEENAEIQRTTSVVTEPEIEPEVTDTVQKPEAPTITHITNKEQANVSDDEYVVVVGPQFRTKEEADKFFEKAYTRIDEPRLILFTDKEDKLRFMVYGGWKTEREAVPCKKFYLGKGFRATIALKSNIVKSIN